MKLDDLLKKQFEREQNGRADLARIASIEKQIFAILHEDVVAKKGRPFSPKFIYGVCALVIIILIVWGISRTKSSVEVAKKYSVVPTHQLSRVPTKNVISPTGKSISPTKHVAPTDKPTKKTDIMLASGFGFNLPDSWSAKISNQSKYHFAGRFFISGVDRSTSYVEIESINTSQAALNPYIEIQNTSNKRINGQNAVINEGKEKFQNSNRLIKHVTFTSSDKNLTLTLYKKPGENIDSQFDQLVESVQATRPAAWWRPLLIKTVHAAEAIAGIDKEKYQRIEVMADPFIAHISNLDPKYKEGYAKFYVFDAFKGQRLTTVAEEDRASNPGSFIKSDLYDESGQKLYSLDTRIEFEAPYTGTYYLITHSFNNQEGSYRFKIFDRNQTENLTYLKYADGREVLVDYNKRPPQYGAEDAALVMQFISPVEVISDHNVQFTAKPREFEADPGQISVPMRLYAKPGSYQSDLVNETHLPEDGQDNLQQIKITKLSPSKILIEPASGGLFLKNYHYNLMMNVSVSGGASSYGGGRFFLENPAQ